MRLLGEALREDDGVLGILMRVAKVVPPTELRKAAKHLCDMPLDEMRRQARRIIRLHVN